MATSAFGGLGLNYLGQENAASGSGMDLGRALLAIGASKSGLEGWLNDKGIGINNGQLGAYKQPTVPVGGSVSAGVPPSITAPQIAAPGEMGRTINPNAEGHAMLNNISQAAPMTSANEQQQLASNTMVPPPAPIMGGVVPPENEYMSGPGMRDKLAQYAAFA
jgi:hypothetical protein